MRPAQADELDAEHTAGESRAVSLLGGENLAASCRAQTDAAATESGWFRATVSRITTLRSAAALPEP